MLNGRPPKAEKELYHIRPRPAHGREQRGLEPQAGRLHAIISRMSDLNLGSLPALNNTPSPQAATPPRQPETAANLHKQARDPDVPAHDRREHRLGRELSSERPSEPPPPLCGLPRPRGSTPPASSQEHPYDVRVPFATGNLQRGPTAMEPPAAAGVLPPPPPAPSRVVGSEWGRAEPRGSSLQDAADRSFPR
ncbi:hypothetical protein PG997_011851 [Apiospora hydei]|uniref:Uncharacterized protein n=1 Tax=Apiospora hydei TaxID=1337664 RepID=A0ABR1V4W8_9PEZI